MAITRSTSCARCCATKRRVSGSGSTRPSRLPSRRSTRSSGGVSPTDRCDVDACARCGFDYELDTAEGAGAAISAGADELAGLVDGPGDVRTRGAPDTWSPLEYGCHVRDVLLVQRERV